jgi:hypothetical protein
VTVNSYFLDTEGVEEADQTLSLAVQFKRKIRRRPGSAKSGDVRNKDASLTQEGSFEKMLIRFFTSLYAVKAQKDRISPASIQIGNPGAY